MSRLDEILGDIEEDWRDMDVGDHTFKNAKQQIKDLFKELAEKWVGSPSDLQELADRIDEL